MRNGLMENHCGTEPHWEKKSGRVDMRSKTNSLTSKPWQTLLTGLSVSQLSSQMPFKPFILFFLQGLFFFLFAALGVCVFNLKANALEKREWVKDSKGVQGPL